MLTMFTLPRSSTSSLAVPMLTTTTNRIGLSRPPSLFSAMFNTPARLSLTAYIFLMEVSICEVLETIAPP